MATRTRSTAWPTLDRVEQSISALGDACEDLERLGLDCYRLVDPEDQLEPVPGAPLPTAEDVAALTVLIEKYGDELEVLDGFLDGFRKLRNSAVYLMGYSEGGKE